MVWLDLGLNPNLPGHWQTLYPLDDLAVRVFTNDPWDLGSIPGRVIPKTQKMVLDASLLNTQHYKVRIKGKVEQSRERVAPSPTPWCSSYRKGSLRVTLGYGRQLYLLPMTKTIKIRRTRHAGHCRRSRDELISDIRLWTPSHGRAKAGWPARIYIQQLCADTGCSLEDLSRAMDDRERWRERVKELRIVHKII